MPGWERREIVSGALSEWGHNADKQYGRKVSVSFVLLAMETWSVTDLARRDATRALRRPNERFSSICK